jgi:hypothetical protein
MGFTPREGIDWMILQLRVGRVGFSEVDQNENDGRLRGVFIKDTAVLFQDGNMDEVMTESD